MNQSHKGSRITRVCKQGCGDAQREELLYCAKHTCSSLERGFTIIEIVISIALFAILTGIAVVVTNPVGQFARARNSQRTLHVNAIMNAVRQNIADTVNGSFSCGAGTIPSTNTKMATGTGNYNIGPCLVPTYLPTMPFDPKASSSKYIDTTNYDSGYFISRNASTGQVTISAPNAELSQTITITR